MPTYTTNYNLKKPTPEDYYNIADFNGNMDTIDSQLKAVSDKADSAFSTDSVIPIANGGTGKTTADEAFAALAANYGYQSAKNLGSVDFDTMTTNGHYSVAFGAGTDQSIYHPPLPESTISTWYNVLVIGPSTRLTQIAFYSFLNQPNMGRVWTRSRHDTTWTDWYEIYTSSPNSQALMTTSQEITLLNGWTLVDGSTSVYQMGKLCFFNMTIKGGTAATAEVIFNLPDGLAPSIEYPVLNEIRRGSANTIYNIGVRSNNNVRFSALAQPDYTQTDELTITATWEAR